MRTQTVNLLSEFFLQQWRSCGKHEGQLRVEIGGTRVQVRRAKQSQDRCRQRGGTHPDAWGLMSAMSGSQTNTRRAVREGANPRRTMTTEVAPFAWYVHPSRSHSCSCTPGMTSEDPGVHSFRAVRTACMNRRSNNVYASGMRPEIPFDP